MHPVDSGRSWSPALTQRTGSYDSTRSWLFGPASVLCTDMRIMRRNWSNWTTLSSLSSNGSNLRLVSML